MRFSPSEIRSRRIAFCDGRDLAAGVRSRCAVGRNRDGVGLSIRRDGEPHDLALAGLPVVRDQLRRRAAFDVDPVDLQALAPAPRMKANTRRTPQPPPTTPRTPALSSP